MEFDLQSMIEQAPGLLISYGVKIVLAIAVYVVGKWIASWIAKLVEKGMTARNVDPTVGSFVRNIVYYLMLVVVIIAALGQLGVQTASFVAILGAAGLAVGFALQGSLANFAAGVLMILFRPFKVGDFVEAGGTAGVVKEISIFSTIFHTPDNKVIIVANNTIMSSNITNYSALDTRRVDLTVGVGYGADLGLVRSTIQRIIDAESRVLKDQDVTIAVGELADSSVNFVVRVWVKTGDYWPVFFDLTEQVKVVFDEVGIEIPFPQMDVHLDKSAD